MTRIIVGYVFNLRNVQNKSNAEGDLMRDLKTAMATLQEVQTDLRFPVEPNKACPHLTVQQQSPFGQLPQNQTAVMPYRPVSYFPTFGLSFFSRLSGEKVERIRLVFCKLGS